MLQVCWLDITVQATTPMMLDAHCGSALRGAFFHALWSRFCTNREARTCAECPYTAGCPVASLVASSRGEWNGGRTGKEEQSTDGKTSRNDPPRPYIVLAPQKQPEHQRESEWFHDALQQIQEGESMTFGLLLLGASTRLFPHVLRTLQEMEKTGFGRRLRILGGQRGHFQLQKVQCYHPFRQDSQLVWQRASTQPMRPVVCITAQDIAAHAQELSAERLTLHFQSPTSLRVDRQFLRRPTFVGLIKRSIGRLAELQTEYGDSGVGGLATQLHDPSWRLALYEQAEAVRLVQDETRWVRVESHSFRQQQTMPIDGFVGRATFEGSLSDFREVLAWGEIVRVGKRATKGNGYYRIESADQPQRAYCWSSQRTEDEAKEISIWRGTWRE